MTRLCTMMASVIFILAMPPPVAAAGKGKGPKNGSPPSSSPLPSPTAIAPATGGGVPSAWIDDASVLPVGTMSLSISGQFWQGTDLNEIQVPAVGVAAGLTPRVQISATVPHVVGDDATGVIGGVGTSYASAKIQILNGNQFGIKLAIAPTIEILGEGALASLGPGESKTQFGLPVSLSVDRGTLRGFASSGWFSGGVWFAGAGVAARATTRVAVSAAFSRAWTLDSSELGATQRQEISGGVAYSMRRQISIFGSVGHTIATDDQNGAGATMSGGVMFILTSSVFK